MAAPRPRPAVPPPALSLQTRIVSQSVILTAFVVVVLTTLSFWIARAILQQSVEAQLRSLSFIAEDSVERTLQGYRERASFAAAQEDIRIMVQSGSDGGAIDATFQALRREEPALRGMALFSMRGRMIASAGETQEMTGDRSERARLSPRVTDRGWEGLDVAVPVRTDGRIIGALVLRFTTADALEPLLTAVPALGSTAHLLFLFEVEQTVRVVHPALRPEASFAISLTDPDRLPALRALEVTGGVGRMENERGRDTLVAHRPLPTLGWDMAIEVERKDALSAVRRLALAHAATGTMLLVIAAALARALARQVTEPLRTLTATVRQLGPGRWTVRKTARTDDEVGVLERVFIDLSARLRRLYDHLEEEIAQRTDALKKQYALDRAILTHIAYGIVTVDRAGMVTGCNPAAAKLLSMTEEGMHGKKAEDVLPLCDKEGNASSDVHPVRATLKKRDLVRSAVGALDTIRRRDGTLLPVTYVASPLIQGRTLFGAILVFQDVSEERKLEERKSEFVTLASHQLRTPLSSLHWYVELLSEEKKSLTPDQREYLVEMQRASDRMLTLLTTLLHAAQYEGKGVQPTIQEVDLSALVADAHEECTAFAKEMHATCDLQLPARKVILQSDPVHLKVVLQNLLSNAVKYASYAQKKQVTCTVTGRNGGAVIRVQDTGIGIPTADQPRIFERFFRAENVRKVDTDGNGLGLSICKSIVERLGGTIAFTSKENEGATFTVTLPGVGNSASAGKYKGKGKGQRTKD